MPSLVVPNAALLRLIWAQGGVPYAVNVIGVRNPTPVAITQALTNTVGAAVKSGLASSGLNAVLPTTVSLLTVGLRDISIANQPELTDVSAAAVGTSVSDNLPPQTALVVTVRTALAGRSYRGRVYLCGFAENANDPTGVASTGTASVAAAFVTAISSALTASGLQFGVLSRPRPAFTPEGGAEVPAYAGGIQQATAFVVRDRVWDTQRRRAVPGI